MKKLISIIFMLLPVIGFSDTVIITGDDLTQPIEFKYLKKVDNISQLIPNTYSISDYKIVFSKLILYIVDKDGSIHIFNDSKYVKIEDD